jgi:hypothetical protein
MEHAQARHHLVHVLLGRQERRAEVQRAGLLPKPAAWGGFEGWGSGGGTWLGSGDRSAAALQCNMRSDTSAPPPPSPPPPPPRAPPTHTH